MLPALLACRDDEAPGAKQSAGGARIIAALA
jgi:hypothetical protein